MKQYGKLSKMLLAVLALASTPYAMANNMANNAKNADLPLFTSFDWAESSTGYIIKGTICTHIANVGDAGCSPVTFVVDTPNHRILLDVGSQGGQQYILEDRSFIIGGVPGVTSCLQVPGFTYASQVAGYENVRSTAGAKTSKATYVGLASDVASCQNTIAASVSVLHGVLSEFDFNQLFPIPGLGLQNVSGVVTLDHSTIDRTSDRSSYFVLPPDCNDSAPNYCDIVFPTPIKNSTAK